MITININEYQMSVNDFNSPNILHGKDAIYQLLIRLLMLEPGTIQSHPDMGVGLISRYRFEDADTAVDDLKVRIQKQISTYLPQLSGVQTRVFSKNKVLYIEIEVNDTLYRFEKTADSNDVTLSPTTTTTTLQNL